MTTLRTQCVLELLAALLTAVAGAQQMQLSSAGVPPASADIHRLLAERVDVIAGQEDGVGIIVGAVEPKGRMIIWYGHLGHGDPRPLNGDTVFELGSVTKVFTALLLADMVRKGEVSLTDLVAKHLPGGIKIPARNGRSITLLDLATHTSGLPFMPDNLPDFDDSAALKHSCAHLYEFLAHYALQRDPGADWEYSNLGYWLLGEALASRAGVNYEQLLRTRVLAPLHMHSTAITASPNLKARLAVGHNAVLRPALPWNVPPYADMQAAGGLVSTTDDLLNFLSVALGYENSSLRPSMAAMLSTRRPGPQGEQALGWIVMGEGDDQLIFHDGGTWGYASAVAWNPKKRAGVVVLSNQLTSVSDIALHLLRPSVAFEPPSAARHTEIALPSATLDAYVGRYEVAEEGIFVIARDADFLTVRLPNSWGLPKLRLRPETSQDFFVVELPVRVTFQTDSEGRVKGMLIYPPRGQHAMAAVRIGLNK